jgi:hypothetical protein
MVLHPVNLGKLVMNVSGEMKSPIALHPKRHR